MYQPYPTGTQLPKVQRPSSAFFKGATLKENNQ
jgi:hypothetical protein